MKIDPREHTDKPLWCVYGPRDFPTMFVFEVYYNPYSVTDSDSHIIWGYGINKNNDKYTSFGQGFEGWVKKQAKQGYKVKFFDKQKDALTYIAKLTCGVKKEKS